MEQPTQLGRYRIDGQLGRGGMGAVYRAFDTVLERPVALKVMLPGTAGPEAAQRLLREAKAAAHLDHAHVVRVYDVASIDGQLCIAMELLRGQSMAAHIAQGRIEPARATRWLKQTADALACAHAAGIVHRDIKPENIHVCPDDSIRILDFGIVKRHTTAESDGWETLSERGAIVGTPHYVSPEQLAQLQPDGRADQFSWGVVAYELFTGQLPWPDGTVLQVLAAVLETTPAAPETLGVAPRISAVITKAISKDPEERFPTIDEAASALEAAVGLSDTVVVGSEDAGLDVPGPSRPTTLRRRAGWLAVAAILVGLAVAWSTTRPPPVAQAPMPSASPSGTAARALTNLPLPESDSAEALAAYRRGLARYRSGSRVLDDMKRAVELDPTLAAAHMRLAVRMVTFEPELARTHAAEAIRYRDRLSPRDQAYLSMLEPQVLARPPDIAAWVARAKDAVAAFPEDAELNFLLGWALGVSGQVKQGRKAFRRATELDSGFAWAWQFLGESQAAAGELDAARATFDACLKHLPVAHTCRVLRSIVRAADGQCQGYREDVGRLRSIAPDDADVLERKAFALATEEASNAAMDEVAAQLKRVAPPWRLHRHRAKWLSYQGDFVAALKELDAWDATAPKRDETRRGEAATLRVLLMLETRANAAAADYAVSYLERREAWIKNMGGGRIEIGLDAVPALMEALRIEAHPKLDALRTRWLAEPMAVKPALVWLHRHAAFAADEASARQALTDAPEGYPPSFGPTSYITAMQGHILLTAGRTKEALPWLEKAALECRRFKWPVLHARALVELARARASQGDQLGACRSYDALLARWSPEQSRTAAEAQRRRTALGCP